MAAGFKTATVRSGDVPATQTNFPSYVDLSRLGITTLAEAESVRVYADSSKTTEWAREIVSVTEMHVKVPSLTSTVVMYVDWDGVRADYAVGATYGRNAVWSDYVAVYHMKDVNDSTENTNTLTNVNSVAFNNSQIGNGADTGSSNTNKSLRRTDALGIPSGASAVMFTTWVKMNVEISTSYQSFLVLNTSTGYRIYQLRYEYNSGSRRLRFSQYNNGAGEQSDKIYHSINLGTSNYYKLTLLWDGVNKLEGFVDSVSIGSLTIGTSTGSSYSQNFTIFSEPNNAAFSSVFQDEVRVKNGTWSADWETTEYNNQNDEATFWGTWTDAGGAPAARRGVVMMM